MTEVVGPLTGSASNVTSPKAIVAGPAYADRLSFVRDSLQTGQEDLGEAIDDAGDAVRRVEALVDELVSVAQYEAGTLKVRPEPIDLSSAIRAAADMAQREAGLRSVEVRIVAAGPVPFDGDRNLVRRVIESLIWCGFRATPARGVIELRSERGQDGAPRLVVACTGTVDVTTSTAPAVYFARSIIDAHRGTFTMTSEPSFATVMSLDWPR